MKSTLCTAILLLAAATTTLFGQSITGYRLFDNGNTTLKVGSVFGSNGSGPLVQDNSSITLFFPVGLTSPVVSSIQGGSWYVSAEVSNSALQGVCGASATGYYMVQISTNGQANLGTVTAGVTEDLFTVAFSGGSSLPIKGLDPTGGDPLSACVVMVGANNTASIDPDGNAGVLPTVGYENIPIVPMSITLPVKLTHFQAEAKESDALLTWQTESEHNFSHYDIERSTDQRNWQNIGKVDGIGDVHSTANYQWTDAAALRNARGEYLYYRLKMVDTDAASEYSPIRSVRVLNPGKTVHVQPNPAANALYITYDHADDTPLTVSLYDNTGKLVLLTTYKTGMPVDVSALPRGVYALQLTDRSTVLATERVVLQ